MVKIYKPEFLVVGGGIAGSPLATLLSRQGYDVLLVERQKQVRRTFKGEYLQPGPVEFLRRSGFGDVFNAKSSTEIRTLRFRDLDRSSRSTASITMKFPEGQVEGRTLEHHDLIEGLQKVAEQQLGENFWRGVELKPANEFLSNSDFLEAPSFIAERDGLVIARIEPKWVLGCDGKASAVRRWMGGVSAPANDQVVLGSGPELIFGAQIAQKSLKPSAYEVFRTKEFGTLSIFSLGEKGQRIYLSSPVANSSQSQVAARLRDALKSIEPLTGHIELPEKLQLTGAPAYTKWLGPAAQGRFILVGDALAVTTPYGGQGTAAAMEHVKHLTEVFNFRAKTRVHLLHEKNAYHEAALKTHERIAILNFGIYYAFFSRPTIFRLSTRQILKTWEANPELKNRVVRLFGGLDTDVPTLAELLNLPKVPFTNVALTLAPKFAPKIVGNDRINWA